MIRAALPALAMLLAVAAPCAAAPSAKRIHPDYQLLRGDVQRYGDWMALCEPNGDCTAIGLPSPDPMPTGSWAAQRYAIRLVLPNMNRILGGHPETLPSMTLIPVGPAPDTMPMLFNLSAAEAWLSAYNGAIARGRLELDSAASTEFRTMLDAGVTPIGIGGVHNRIVAVFPSGQFFTDMMNGIEEAQSRTIRPAAETPPVRLAFAPAEMTSRLPFRPPPAACPARATGYALAAFRLPPEGAQLYALTCPETASTDIENVTNQPAERADLTGWEQRMPGTRSWLFQAAPGSPDAQPLALPDTGGRTVHAGIAGLANVSVDFDFGTLRSYDAPDGREDCGTLRVWGWTAQGWILLQRAEMPVCAGLYPPDWLVAYSRASDRDGAD